MSSSKTAKAQRMLDLVGDMEEVATAFGRSVQTIKNWLTLSSADARIHTAVRAGKISATAACDLAKLESTQQLEALDSVLAATEEEPISRSSLKGIINKVTSPDDGSASSPSSHSTSKAKGQAEGNHTQLGEESPQDSRSRFSFGGAKSAYSSGLPLVRRRKGTWYDDFQWNADNELEASNGKVKAKRKKTGVKC